MISSENLKKEESAGTLQHKSPEYKGSIGVQAWLKIREDWLKKDYLNGKVKTYAKSKPVSDNYREEVSEILRSVKPPYPALKHNIRLEDMVDILMEVLEEDED